jgi:hypothetical protein
MSLNALLLPALLLSVDTGKFGAYEGRISHYGALNTFVNNTNELFGEDAIEKIRNTPFTRDVTIPILNRYDHTVLTVRSCNISGPDISPTLKNLTRVHLAIDMQVTPAKYQDNAVSVQRALRHQYMNAKRAVYTMLDSMAATTLDLNKDTSTLSQDTNHPLYTRVAGAYQIPASRPEDFYLNFGTIMEELDVHGPYFDVASTIALADKMKLRNPGGGTQLDTAAILRESGIAEFEHSNRIARGNNRTVHYVAPQGSVGVLNFIDFDYQEGQAPELGSPEDIDQWDKAGNLSNVALWSRCNDEIYTGWQWGVLQKIECLAEQRVYSTKLSADFAFATDFTSETGVTPIKRFELVQQPI